MKRLVRSIFEPSPRTVSVRSLALLVGGLLSGIGISVHEYLQSGRPVVRASSPASVEPGTCKREGGRSACTVPSSPVELPRAAPSSIRDPQPAKREAESAPTAAPTQWTPDEASTTDLREDPAPESGFSRSGRVSSQ